MLPERESKVVGLNKAPEKKPPMIVLLIATIDADLKSEEISNSKTTIFAKPNRIKGNGLGMKLSKTYTVTAKAVKNANFIILLSVLVIIELKKCGKP